MFRPVEAMDFLSRSAARSTDQDPFDLLRLAVGLLLGFATIVAVVLWFTGMVPRALFLVGVFWSIYGLAVAVVDGILDPAIAFLVEVLQNAGLLREPVGYSAIEAMVARGSFDSAAAAYSERAEAGDTQALVRRAALLAGPLGAPGMAVAELDNYRDTRRLAPEDDIRVGLALADLLEHRQADPGRAMVELRRMIDRYPTVRGIRRIRLALEELKKERFGAAHGPPPA